MVRFRPELEALHLLSRDGVDSFERYFLYPYEFGQGHSLAFLLKAELDHLFDVSARARQESSLENSRLAFQALPPRRSHPRRARSPRRDPSSSILTSRDYTAALDSVWEDHKTSDRERVMSDE